jgi:hypothetical protein
MEYFAGLHSQQQAQQQAQQDGQRLLAGEL